MFLHDSLGMMGPLNSIYSVSHALISSGGCNIINIAVIYILKHGFRVVLAPVVKRMHHINLLVYSVKSINV